MRTAFPRTLALGLAASMTLGGCASRPRTATSEPAAAELPGAEEQLYVARAASLRSRILERASWTDLGEGCNIGTFRTFADTTIAGRAQIDTLVLQLERVVIARGVSQPIDTPAGRDLIRLVALWEAAGPRPIWDAEDRVERRAVAAGLTGQVFNPETKRCESYVEEDSMVVILPANVSLGAIEAKDAMTVTAYAGDSAIARARGVFFDHPGRTVGATFQYTRIGPVVLWRDWGLVVVRRPLEIRNGAQITESTVAGGATYLFRRRGNSWRLFLITRTWA